MSRKTRYGERRRGRGKTSSRRPPCACNRKRCANARGVRVAPPEGRYGQAALAASRAARAPGEEAACVQQARRNQPVRFGRYEFVSERPDVRAQRGSRRAHRCRGFDRSEDEPGHLSRRRFSRSVARRPPTPSKMNREQAMLPWPAMEPRVREKVFTFAVYVSSRTMTRSAC